MAGSFAALDAGLPDPGGAESTERKLRALQDYLVLLLEQLRYVLRNLGAENFNAAALDAIGEKITAPIRAELGALDGDYAALAADLTGLRTEVGRKLDSASLITAINQSADKIAASAVRTDAEGTTLASYVEQTADAIAAKVSAADVASAVSQSADALRLEVKGGYAREWTSGSTYYKNDVVKVTTRTDGAVAAVGFYQCKHDGAHTAAAGNKPGTGGGAACWESVPNADVQSVIDLNLQGITLSYDHSQLGAGEHNAAYVTLNKDGVAIGGGKVFVRDLDAGTITTGTLDAGNITLQEAFTVKAKDRNNAVQDCGFIGGYARTGGANTVTVADASETQRVDIEGTGVYLSSEGSGETHSYASVEADCVELACYADHNNGCLLELSPTGLRACKKVGGAWGSWTTLI